ncbi:hypothetical protein JGI7_00122 [Candidatus Kryptonium thompsonii]|mgnify:CR=1 FL=1|uniref:Probable membrane transporter protein n=2 Tax=Candidatus Kryptonium thompsonii TaxID=1633631 RepID=A0A0P1NUA2_9BACT|nr:sulfite exporter TauE/SafE family protein [Candidatus Kryptonium thompsoni]CUS77544.1 hypothetical protein JGI7_00122 [Candidatus Kryptonium thompsoni]CUS79857.1 hypothetical protein JGI14_10071 [Candidatus Kryptonium thompsoni]CUS80759.1 hypothetical protein JGI16_10303 [Candidatus Kryptonium thompsoni]CUS82044.1 hypothetical protein JGI12_00544 [Candidatus Kryptonium thompsoni]CUS84249.1 hypothetical protein JGI13_01034 [Candidatus Kryptonium thompsoni]
MDQLFVEILIGLSIGFLSGFFGLGGSSIATPLLKLFANVKPVYALATPLLVALPSAISGAVVYYRNNHVDFKLAKLTVISGFPFVIVGAVLTRFVSGKFLMISTGLFIFLISLSFVFRRKLFNEQTTVVSWHYKNLRNFVLGASVGLVSGFLANGGGVILVPVYVKIFKLDIKDAFGTSLFVVPFFAVPGAITHFILGHIDLKLFLILALSAIPLANLSAKVAVRLKSENLEIAYGVFILLFSIFFMFREILHA